MASLKWLVFQKHTTGFNLNSLEENVPHELNLRT
jgi:hypothetical protein